MHAQSQLQAQVEASFFSVKLTKNTISGEMTGANPTSFVGTSKKLFLKALQNMASIRKLNADPTDYCNIIHTVFMHWCMAAFIYI